MIKKLILSFSLVCCLISCSNPIYYPFFIENIESVVASKNIAIMPCNLLYENKYSKNEAKKRMIQDSIGSELHRRGFVVIDQDQVNKDVDSIQSTFANFYNPKTGEIDTTVTRDFRDAIIQHMITKYKVTSVLFPYIRIVKAYINGGYSWDGRYKYSFVLSNANGATTALSLYVRIFDVNKKMVFDNAGGIQLLSPYDPKHGGFRAINDDEVLKDPKDLSAAIEIVFKPLNDKLPTSK